MRWVASCFLFFGFFFAGSPIREDQADQIAEQVIDQDKYKLIEIEELD